MAINFPHENLVIGQEFTSGNRSWTWNGTSWVISTRATLEDTITYLGSQSDWTTAESLMLSSGLYSWVEDSSTLGEMISRKTNNGIFHYGGVIHAEPYKDFYVGNEPGDDFSTPLEATNALSHYRISHRGRVRVFIRSGVYTHDDYMDMGHPDGDRIWYEPLDGMVTTDVYPSPEDFTGDPLTDFPTISSYYNVVILTAGGGIDCENGFGRISNVCFKHTGTDPGAGFDGINASNGKVSASGSTFFGFPNHGIITANSTIASNKRMCLAHNDNQGLGLADNSYGSFGGTPGADGIICSNNNNNIVITRNSHAALPHTYCLSAQDTNIQVTRNSSINQSSNPSLGDYMICDTGRVGLYVEGGSYVKAPSAQFTNCSQEPVLATRGSFILFQKPVNFSTTGLFDDINSIMNSSIFMDSFSGNGLLSGGVSFSIPVTTPGSEGDTYGTDPVHGLIRITN